MNTKKIRKKVICLLFTVAFMMLVFLIVEAGAITLASGGSTSYSIVSDIGDSNEVDLAVSELKDHIEQSTGATFPSVDVSVAGGLTERIIVGDNTLSRSILGSGTIDALAEEEALVVVSGNDLILVGGDPRGTLYSVYSFLENEVGCRWYVDYLGAVIPQHTTLTVGAVNRSEIPDYSYSTGGFNYWSDPQAISLWSMRNRADEGQIASGLEASEKTIGAPIHTLFFYIPPHEHNPAWAHLFNPPDSNFFETNPEYFSQFGGVRVDNKQLNFSNAGLRAKLTQQIAAVIDGSLDYVGQKASFSLSAMDTNGRFCEDAGCLALEASYGCIGGPYFDYVLNDLSPYLATNYPNITVEILAYRKDQSEEPPAGVNFPDNVRVLFAPIGEGGSGNDFAQPLDSSTNLDTLNNLTGWCADANNVRVWYYPTPFMSAGPPFSSVDRIVTDVNLMHQLGVKDFTTQPHTPTTDKVRGLNFADLDYWLMRRLTIDANQNAGVLVTEFLSYQFGPAASLMATYISELHTAQDGMVTVLEWNSTLPDFTYLTPANLVAWEDDFDEMEAVAASSHIHLRNVRTARITLDTAMLEKWDEVIAAYPSLERTPQELYVRIIESARDEMEARALPQYYFNWWGPFLGKINAMYIPRRPASGLPTPYLYWSFDEMPIVGSGSWPTAIDATPGTSPFEANVPDLSGNDNEGLLMNTQYYATTTVPITSEISPITSNVSGIHFGDVNTIQQVRRVDETLPASLYSGITLRGIWSFDEELPLPNSDFYEMMQLQDYMLIQHFKGATEYVSCSVLVLDGANPPVIRSVSALRSDIELAIGHSIIGEATVFAGTYNKTELALYADGIKVASQTYGTPQEMYGDDGMGDNRFCIGNDTGSSNARSRKAAFDEFKVWDVALTAEQVAADYGEIIGGDEGTCAAAWALGNGLPGDLNKNCSVDVEDMAIFASEWLSCTPAADVNCQ